MSSAKWRPFYLGLNVLICQRRTQNWSEPPFTNMIQLIHHTPDIMGNVITH